ncbi:DUF255 domain-containing protein [Luteolibacter flavescens]|uniref:DUF255 domain-containing protein n=1 Tax=Luteolibacter flavescens TaxID=1859460 RepID=A0ABT3FVX6_9BACT|nr:DUF255 domain-containing protein [Luteolibacter flavescens]MCW1887741.1 DUF255 domain-containing protein [Luteolibacter flavescens]
MSKVIIPAIGLLALTATVSSCRKGESSSGSSSSSSAARPIVSAELENQMANAPQGLLASRKDSPVKWQQWDPAILKRSRDADRLIFVFLCSAQYPGCLEALDAIDQDPELVARFNNEFIPVLAELSVARECGIAAGMLSEELRAPMNFPYVLLLSPDGHEVGWRAIPFDTKDSFRDSIDNVTDMAMAMWREDPAFTHRNSKSDHARRMSRIPQPDAVADAATRDAFLLRTTRQMISQYDQDIGTLSGTGGLFPIGSLQFLALAANSPTIPQDIAARSREAVSAFGHQVLRSAMVDPLDGGVYTTRMGPSWDLPIIQRTCMTQARSARALVSLYSSIGDALPLDVALGAVKFAEEQFSTADGLFANQRQPVPTKFEEWMWSSDQINAALSPQEAALWKALFSVQDLGNLPMEVDPSRKFFRLNTFGTRIPMEKAAAAAKVDPAQAPALYESARKKLLAARLTRMPQPAPAAHGEASSSFRMVSAYAALFTATGDIAWRDKALALAKGAREAFSKGNLLIEQGAPVSPVVADARAFTYALAIQAALDLAEVTLDESWRLWAGDLATVVGEQFIDKNGRMLEARPASTPLQLLMMDRIMLFDDSTVGLMRMNAARLEALGQPSPPEMAKLASSLPRPEIQPIVVADSILAASFARSRVIVELPADPSAEWRDAATKLPLDLIARRIGTGSTVTVHLPDGTKVTPANPADLAAAVAAPKP